jgi:3',5'-cyclic AMP phosphodiesterase CpdA
MMKLLQITDIHLTTPGQTIAGRDPNANFDKALAHALAHHADAEALFITGDLSDWGEEDDYRRLAETVARLSLPVHLAIGNHDDRPTLLRAFPELEGEGGFVHYEVPLSLGHALVLDTWGEKTHAGHFCETRAAWLDARLGALPGPVWIFMHHNPVAVQVAPMDEIMLRDAGRFAEAIRPHRDRIAHIFHGHCHLPLSGSLLGVPFSAPRGTNHAGWADFAATGMLSGADLAEAYAVIFASPESTMVHMVEFGYAGPIHADGSPDYADWTKTTVTR